MTALKLTDAELEHGAPMRSFRLTADAATAKAAWALVDKLKVSGRHLEDDRYWAGWNSARDVLQRAIETAGIPRAEEVAG